MKNNYTAELQIKRSGILINAISTLPANSLKVWMLSIAHIKWLDDDKIKIDDKGRVITTISKENLKKFIPKLMNQKNYIRSLKKTALDLTEKKVGVIKDKEKSWEFIGSYATRAKYENDLLTIYHNIEVLDLVDVDRKFTEYFYKHISTLKHSNYIKMYDLCIQSTAYGNSRCEHSVDYLREFFNVQKGQLERNSDFVKYIIQSSVNNVNVDKNTNIEIAFKSIKKGNKITNIGFETYITDIHPLDSIEQRPKNLKTELINLGFKKEKLKPLLQISTHILIQAIKETKVEKEKGFKKTMEDCFFYKLSVLKSLKGEKLKPLAVVEMFKENLGVKNVDLYNEFHAQLSKELQETYFKANNSKDKTIRKALKRDYYSRFNQWIYKTKIQQEQKP